MKFGKHLLCVFTLVLLTICLPLRATAQIEKVTVERYYVSDANDATDTFGGYLEPGSVTYRVYIDLLPGCVLKKFMAM